MMGVHLCVFNTYATTANLRYAAAEACRMPAWQVPFLLNPNQVAAKQGYDVAGFASSSESLGKRMVVA
jgi:hypothetical protein